MKFLTILLLLIGAACFVGKWSGVQPSAETVGSAVEKLLPEADPAAAMERLVAEFPMETDRYSVSYDVRKTDSLINPVVGYLNFSESVLDPRYVFHWIGGRWQFSKMFNRENGLDFTYTGGGMEIMRSEGMRQFLARHGRPDDGPFVEPSRLAPITPAAPPFDRYGNPRGSKMYSGDR